MADAKPQHRVTDADRDRVRALHTQGHGRNEISRRTGLAEGTVGNIARALGLSFDRSATAALTASRAEDLRARRQRIQLKMLTQAEQVLDDLASGQWQTLIRGDQGAEREVTLDFVPARDRKDAVWAVGAYVANDERLERVTGDSGQDAARSMLVGLLRDVQGAWHLAQQQEAAVDFDQAEQDAPTT